MRTADLGRLAVAATCAALGVHPDALGLATAVTLARAWGAPIATWGRHHLSWPPRRARHSGSADGKPIGRGVPEPWR